jgi:hypothetical protein
MFMVRAEFMLPSNEKLLRTLPERSPIGSCAAACEERGGLSERGASLQEAWKRKRAQNGS